MLFFDASGAVLFERNDMESGSIVHEEMSLQALFPYDEGRVIHRGMRCGLEDATGAFQAYEIRKVKNYEPDHYQEITAEHICIAELTDEFFGDKQWTDITAQAALAQILSGTGWAVGTVDVTGTSSANIINGDVWTDVRAIERAWNCHILPRLTVDAHGITGKYLDIIPPDGIWRGFRVSLEKNADEMGVTWDDSRVKTALYAFGKATGNSSADSKPLTFANVEWTATAEHPAKPLGQTYLEDPAATAEYGRNGRPRFAYYQNGDISDPEILLQKTWESLKTLNHPDVTVDCLVCDLYRLGYTDVPLRLYDTALAEIKPTGTVLRKQIIQYTEDLIDPSQSRISIGTYIPNIIYINRETSKAAGRGGGGGGGQSNKEYEDSVFKAWFDANALELTYTAAELQEIGSTVVENVAALTVNRNNITALAAGEGAQVKDGKIVVDANGDPIFVSGKGLYSKIEQNAQQIALKVSKGGVATQLTVECGNVSISNGNLVVDGYVTAAGLKTAIGNIDELNTQNLLADYLGVGSGGINVQGDIICEGLNASSVSTSELVVAGVDCTLIGDAVASFGTPTASGGQISIPWTKVDGTAGTPINFNIADTAFYQHGVSASVLSVVSDGWAWDSDGEYMYNVIKATNTVSGQTKTGSSVRLPSFSASLSGNTITVRAAASGGTTYPVYDIPLQTKTITADGTYRPVSGKYGFSSVTVSGIGAGGIRSSSLTGSSNSSSDMSQWASDSDKSLSLSAKYGLITVIPNSGSAYDIAVNALGTYNAGWNGLITACQDSSTGSNYTQFSGASAYNSNLARSGKTITGYVWLKNASGTWVRTRQIKINATNYAQSLYYEDEASGRYIPYPSGRVVYSL